MPTVRISVLEVITLSGLDILLSTIKDDEEDPFINACFLKEVELGDLIEAYQYKFWKRLL